jgi:16S rRNA processing protein RimM
MQIWLRLNLRFHLYMLGHPSGEFIRIGSVVRPHGLSGEVVVSVDVDLDIEQANNLNSFEIFYVRNDRGDFIPMRVERSQVIFKNKQFSFFVKFVQVSTRETSEALKGQDVFLLSDDLEIGEEESYIDYDLISEKGESYGLVTDVLDNPAHPILEISGNKGRILVPFVEAYIISVDDEAKRIIGKNIEYLM